MLIIKRTFLTLALLTSWQIYPTVLSNNILKAADEAGIFNKAIVDILKVRQKMKEFISGKLIWKGVESFLTITDSAGYQISEKLRVIVKRPEALFGASFVVITPNHPLALNFTAASYKNIAQEYIAAAQKKTLLARHEESNYNAVPTGMFALNPITQEAMPIFISDYILEGYDARITQAHVAIPAHDQKDFEFAQINQLPIKLVINSAEQGKTSSPQFNKTTKQLVAAYNGDYDDCIIINSEFLNGSIRTAHDQAVAYLQEHNAGTEYKKPIVYQLGSKQYTLHELQLIEATLAKENKELSPAQKELLAIIMIQAQADLLMNVEQFLANAKEVKDLMVDLIEECFTLRNNKDSYLLKWAHMNTTETEKVIFKRDINSFTKFYKFCSELIDFLGDFASSCPKALETIKNLKHS